MGGARTEPYGLFELDRLAPSGAWLAAAFAAFALLLLAFAERTIFGGQGPYEVSAHRSELSATTDTAVLSGEVEITQNARRFRAPRVVVTFAPAPKPAGRSGGARSIRHLEADGPAYFVTPDQSVRADHASYDAASGDIVLTGGVVVTHGRDVSAGDRLVINEAAGSYTLSAAPGGRVRSVIYPR